MANYRTVMYAGQNKKKKRQMVHEQLCVNEVRDVGKTYMQVRRKTKQSVTNEMREERVVLGVMKLVMICRKKWK